MAKWICILKWLGWNQEEILNEIFRKWSDFCVIIVVVEFGFSLICFDIFDSVIKNNHFDNGNISFYLKIQNHFIEMFSEISS